MPFPEAVIISSPLVDFEKFLGRTSQAFDYSLSKAADSSTRDMSDAEKFMSCLAALRDKNAKVSYAPNPSLLPHVSFSVLVFGDEEDIFAMLEHCAGMPFVIGKTMVTRILATVVTGTLAQWRDAVAAGSEHEVKQSIRAGFNNIYFLFKNENLNMWTNYKERSTSDGTLFLEHKIR